MKKKYYISLLLCLALLVSGCDLIMQPGSTENPALVTQSLQGTSIPLETLAPNQDPLNTLFPIATVTMLPIITPSPEPTPNNTMNFYSCYAVMKSYNPANSWASFDYFYMLKGQDAIDYLMANEGYTQTDAENLVNNFADSEFVTQNNNPGLRIIDLDTIPVRMMYHPDGTMLTNAAPALTSIADINALYNLDPKYVLEYFFYYVTCDSNDNVIGVDQVYWP